MPPCWFLHVPIISLSFGTLFAFPETRIEGERSRIMEVLMIVLGSIWTPHEAGFFAELKGAAMSRRERREGRILESIEEYG